MELVAVHNISMGAKGERVTIKAGQRFNPYDYQGHFSGEELQEMIKNGNVAVPDQISYATPAVLRQQQRAAATAPVTEGRSPRTDIGAGRTAETSGGITRPTQIEPADADDDGDDEDDDTGRPQAKRGRRKTAAKENDEADDDNEV